MSAPEGLDVLGQKIENSRQPRRYLNMTLIDFRAALSEFFIQILQFFDQRAGQFEEDLAIMSELDF